MKAYFTECFCKVTAIFVAQRMLAVMVDKTLAYISSLFAYQSLAEQTKPEFI